MEWWLIAVGAFLFFFALWLIVEIRNHGKGDRVIAGVLCFGSALIACGLGFQETVMASTERTFFIRATKDLTALIDRGNADKALPALANYHLQVTREHQYFAMKELRGEIARIRDVSASTSSSID